MNAKDELLRLCADGGSHARIKYLRNKIKRATIAELRRLLRERGVRFNEFKFMTQWAGSLGESVEAYPTDTFPDTLLVKHAFLTPEQAVTATLGMGTCHNVHEPPEGTTFWPVPHFKCSVCGKAHVSMDYVYFCPNCGRRVEEAVE